MKIKEPKNKNYAAVVVEIKTLKPLVNADRVQGAIIFGNQVIVDLDTKIGDIGLYFPLETQLSKEYLSSNNLYKNKDLNVDKTKAGYFEENGRIRCVKFRGNNSEGLFMPITSLDFIYPPVKTATLSGADISDLFDVGEEFDELEKIPICNKYVPKNSRTPGTSGTSGSNKTKSSKKYESKLVENQFRFHQETSMIYKNLHKISPNSLISITYKLHGTSGISSYVLCKRKIPKREKIGAFIHNIYTNITTFGKQKFRLEDKEYDYLYSSRKVIKNEELNPNAQHYYKADIWGIANGVLKPHLQKGMTLYYEIVGYLPSGGMIQKGYDYGYTQPDIILGHNYEITPINSYKEGVNYGIYIYRITQTNIDGKVFEFSAKQVQDFCLKNGLNPVKELYYGYAKGLFKYVNSDSDEISFDENWQEVFLNYIKSRYNEKDCFMSKTKVPEEGCVIRLEGLNLETYKQKSNAFYALETKQLDKDEFNIEEEN